MQRLRYGDNLCPREGPRDYARAYCWSVSS